MIRLYRVLPFVVVLAIIIAIAYVIMSFRYTSEKAKMTLIGFLTWLFVLLSILLAIITLYAIFEHNAPVIELFGSCLAIALVGLIVALICKAIFKKRHPNYGEKVSKATIINKSLGSRFAEAFKKALKNALKEIFKKP